MNSGVIKRAICIILCIVMASALSVPVLAKTAQVTPIIYIGGITDNRLYSDPDTTKAKPVFLPDDTTLYSSVVQIIAGLGAAMLGADSQGVALASKGIKNLLSPIACKDNGVSSSANVGVMTYNYPLSFYTADESVCTEVISEIGKAAADKVGYDNIFIFTYDWRLDPMDNARKLATFIDYVRAYTGFSKTALIAGGYGGIIANAYLFGNAAHAASCVASCVFLNSAVFGNSIMGDFMKGNLSETVTDSEDIIDAIRTVTGEERGSALIRYTDDDPYGFFVSMFSKILGEGKYTSALSYSVVWLVNYILEDQNLYAKLGASYNVFALSCGDGLYDGCLRDSLRNMPGLWALVPPDDYDAAIEFMFGDDPIPSAQLEQKLTDYRAVVDATEDTLKAAMAAGINVTVVANYNLQVLPLTGTIEEESDCIMSTQLASMGAATNDVDVHWEGVKHCNKALHDHVSPDLLIDASTCILPENTWFIKNLTHLDFSSDTAAEFVVWLAVSNGVQRTVHDTGKYPQFLSYSKITKTVFPYIYGKNPNGYPYGDCNCDGKVSSEDARLALRCAVALEKLTAQGLVNADVDFDGKVTSSDARIILRITVGLQKITDNDESGSRIPEPEEPDDGFID